MDPPTSWVSFLCVAVCGMTGNIKGPMGGTNLTWCDNISSFYYLSLLPVYLLSLWDIYLHLFSAFSHLRNGPAASIHAGGGRQCIHPRLSRAHTHTHVSAQMLHLTLPTAAFHSFNVCKPDFISPPCIMARRWNHQRKASLTKWERQIVCSIRRERSLSDLIGSH